MNFPLSSDHVLELTEVPERVVIIGGGAIGVEFGSMLSDFGSQVTLLEGEKGKEEKKAKEKTGPQK